MKAESNIVFIYTLEDPITGEVRYVGKTKKSLKTRFMGHLDDKKKSHKTNWIKNLRNNGLAPKIQILETLVNPLDDEWKEAECFWIESLRFCGCKLTNLCAGGVGTSNPCAETRMKMSLAKTGFRHTDAAKEKVRMSAIGRKIPQDAIDRRVAAYKATVAKNGRPPISEETRRRCSIASTGRIKTAESIARQVASYKLSIHKRGPIEISDETRRKLSLASSLRKHSEATRARMKEARRKWHARLTPEQKVERVAKQRATVVAKKQALEGCLINN